MSWLTRHCGREVVERIWKPLLNSRFDSDYDELPATYLWARTNRMRSARKGRAAAARRWAASRAATSVCRRRGRARARRWVWTSASARASRRWCTTPSAG